MLKYKRIAIILAVLLALVIVLLTAKAIADNALHEDVSTPEITASPEVTLPMPEPPINASPEAKLSEPKPEVETVPAPPTAPDNIPFVQPPSTPFYTSPFTRPQYLLPGPTRPPVAPNVPSPVQPLPPEVTGPVEGLTEPLVPILEPITEPLEPITDPLLDTVEEILPVIPPLLK